MSEIIDIFNKNRKVLTAFAFKITRNKEDAEDAIQEVYLKISKVTHSVFSPMAFFHRITKNEAFDIIKKRKKYVPIEKAADKLIAPPLPSREPTPPLDVLTIKQREVINAILTLNISQNEFARRNGYHMESVRTHYKLAVANMRRVCAGL